MQACPIRMPDALTQLFPAHQRPVNSADAARDGTGTTSSSGSAPSFAHPFLFLPSEQRPDAWASALRASQFPGTCSRYLLVQDDLAGSGLGWTARFHAITLLLAARQSRVMLEVPVYRNGSGARWCTQPPFTMQCLYEQWTHCEAPSPSAVLSFEEHCALPGVNHTCGPMRNKPCKLRDHCKFLTQPDLVHAPAVSLRLSTVLLNQDWWQRAALLPGGPEVIGAAHRLLFGSPRAWVRDLATCTMMHAQLETGRFSTVHIRLSPEKAREVARSGRVMPTVEGYSVLAQAVAQSSGLHRVFVQTANADALREFSGLCRRAELNVSHTTNPRSEHDNWGGWVKDADTISLQAAAGAVNAHVARQAAVLVSPSISIWTTFLGYLMEVDDEQAGLGVSSAVAADRGPELGKRPLLVSSYQCAGARQRGLRTGYLRVVVRQDRVALAAKIPGQDAVHFNMSDALPRAVKELKHHGRCTLKS